MLALRSPDPALGLPPGTILQPTILVRNTTAKTISADIALSWRSNSVKGIAKLAELRLGPFATQQLQIGEVQKPLGIPDDAHWALVSLTTGAAPDDLVAIASSRDASGRYGAETRFIGGRGGQFAGGEWRADANHNEIATITNIGTKPTDALLTLHYDNGTQKYELQRTIAPGDQMWVNLAQLIRNRVADRKGNTLPADLNSVTSDLQDLTPGGHGLMVNAVALDRSFGFQAGPDVLTCCGDDDASWAPDAFDLVIDGTEFGSISGVNQCTGQVDDISSYFTSWWSGNSAVATVTTKEVQGVAAGSTDAYASGYVEEGNGSYCTVVAAQAAAPVTVFDVAVFGKDYIFVGTDPNELYGNRFSVANSAGTGLPQPTGGVCCAGSSDSSDEVSQVAGPPNDFFIFQFTTTDQSVNVGDRTLTFEYSVSSGSTAVQKSVTARKFHYATNNNPSNTCDLGYGTNLTYVYNVYTDPDHAVVLPTDGLTNTSVTENFNPTLTCQTGTGNTILNTNAQFSDNIASACSSKPLTCNQTSTQTLSVAGYPVRTNTLQWTSTGVTYTSDGPTD